MIAHTLVDRTRDYTRDALNDLFEAMGKVEREHGLIPKLTEVDAKLEANWLLDRQFARQRPLRILSTKVAAQR